MKFLQGILILFNCLCYYFQGYGVINVIMHACIWGHRFIQFYSRIPPLTL